MHWEDIVIATTFRPLTQYFDTKTWKQDPCWQLLTYVTFPIDDVIRAAAIPVLAAYAHFQDIYNCLASEQASKKIEGIIKVLATPVWFPVKLTAKTLFFSVPFLMLGGVSLLIP